MWIYFCLDLSRPIPCSLSPKNTTHWRTTSCSACNIPPVKLFPTHSPPLGWIISLSFPCTTPLCAAPRVPRNRLTAHMRLSFSFLFPNAQHLGCMARQCVTFYATTVSNSARSRPAYSRSCPKKRQRQISSSVAR